MWSWPIKGIPATPTTPRILHHHRSPDNFRPTNWDARLFVGGYKCFWLVITKQITSFFLSKSRCVLLEKIYIYLRKDVPASLGSSSCQHQKQPHRRTPWEVPLHYSTFQVEKWSHFKRQFEQDRLHSPLLRKKYDKKSGDFFSFKL